ncbi:RsmF rRNA methyltransferase first C-terminal domain-containing protein [Fusibacter bizertensis]
MNLPEVFTARMKKKLGEAYTAFIETYDEEHHVSLSVNTLKISVASFLEIFPYPLEPVPWTTDGFYYRMEDPVTKHPYYHAGLYYIQEPSAMSAVNVLKPSPGDFCLDLCAAPGGKSMQISNFIEDEGILVTNDINETRVKAILRNVEKFGLRNVLVLNESPDKISKVIGNCFDSILIDAPCSGEGMFRKDPRAVKSWETYGPAECHIIQREIIDQLENLVGEKAKIVYSTCTFAETENEDQIGYLLSQAQIFSPGEINLEGIGYNDENTKYMTHIWPHLQRGEGHFISSLSGTTQRAKVREKYPENEPPEVFQSFMDKHFKKTLKGYFQVEGEKLFLKPVYKLPTKGLNVVREGLLLGEIKKGRFTPSQALAIYLKADEFTPKLDLAPDYIDTLKYLKGETIFVDNESEGLHLICTNGFPLGFAKISGGTVKNMYPASWRVL